MAFQFQSLVTPLISSSVTRLSLHQNFLRPGSLSNNAHTPSRTKCLSGPISFNTSVATRSENPQYKPTIWDYTLIESLRSNYSVSTSSTPAQSLSVLRIFANTFTLFLQGETCTDQSNELKEGVRVMFKRAVRTLAQLELINVVERLGLGYLFEEEIDRSLQRIYGNIEKDNYWMKENLYATSLCFRVLRQHGYQVSQEVFNNFTDETGNFNKSIRKDIKGMLSLYEAAHVSSEGEYVLEYAKDFTSKHLKELKENIEPKLVKQVNRSLSVPLHWRMTGSEAKSYIDAYEGENSTNPILLELAKLDFNMVQSTFHKDLRNMSRWWRNLGIAAKLNFARDRLVESFLWSVGISYQPKNTRCREWLTKVMNFVLIIDDIYDVYGTMDELKLFTDVIERWDYQAMEKLPYYMRICFLALYNTTNEMAYEILKEQGFDVTPYLKKSWANFIKAMFVEAKWCNAGYTPPLEEYLGNGWLSSSGSVFLVHTFFATKQAISTDILESLNNNHNLLYCASMIFRLSNDLATSSAELERGDVASSIGCYMRETNVSETEAREHIRGLIMNMWKKLNGSITDSPFDFQFVNAAINLARTSLFIYQHGDGLGVEDSKSKDHIFSLIVNPIDTDYSIDTDNSKVVH
ncbi:hypothetical protein GIB67_006193, partial [Kingdonia uniflora]